MNFIVETGDGVENANAYVSVAAAISYHTDRGNAAWASATIPEQKAAIVKATDHIELLYGHRFLGEKVESDQSLSWPRSNAYDDYGNAIEGVPPMVVRACCEYALRALEEDLIDESPAVSAEQETEGGLSRQVTYASPGTVWRWPQADRMLTQLTIVPIAVRA